MTKKIKSSLFDELFKLQNAAPEVDFDPEDLTEAFDAKQLTDRVDETEIRGPSDLKKKSAVICDDPKYKGTKISRKTLYSDNEESQLTDSSDREEQDENSDSGQDELIGSDENETASNDDSDEDRNEENMSEDQDEEEHIQKGKKFSVYSETKSNEREKGKAVAFQLGVWDDLMKCRIGLQKVVAGCNKLPQPESWQDFTQDNNFRTEANNVHSSIRKLMSGLLELQLLLSNVQKHDMKSDEEITSESETEETDETKQVNDKPAEMKEQPSKGRKRKLDCNEVEEIINKRHKDFQSYRNDTLSKWDEKTKLSQGNVKSKNFASFQISVLKQIEQVLANKERLIRRLHQQRSYYKILGKDDIDCNTKTEDNEEVEDWDDEQNIQLKLKQSKPELPLNTEIIDDNDFYHVCLRDLIEMKQNEETDPVIASKQWLEIQRLRNKQKKKVDTKASKGRKIRYNVKEKLKNFMTPFDKSLWSDEQKDEFFKTLFGGISGQSN